jgi:hypothetical protein
VIAMDGAAVKKVRQNFSSIKPSNILVWGASDFWQKLIAKLPDATAHENASVAVDDDGNKKFDDEMWTYLKGVKVDASVLVSIS